MHHTMRVKHPARARRRVAVHTHGSVCDTHNTHLDFVVITAGDEEGVLRMEADTTHWAFMLFEPIQQRAHAVVEQLDDTIVQGSQDPWPLWVKAQTLDAVGLALEFDELHRDTSYSTMRVAGQAVSDTRASGARKWQRLPHSVLCCTPHRLAPTKRRSLPTTSHESETNDGLSA